MKKVKKKISNALNEKKKEKEKVEERTKNKEETEVGKKKEKEKKSFHSHVLGVFSLDLFFGLTVLT